MAATLDDKAQLVLSSEIDGCDDVGRFPGSYSERAWLRCPGINPTRGLCQGWMISNVIGVS
jgi:hypothetical protein